MLSIQRVDKIGRLLTEFDLWAVHEMVLTPTKLEFIWEWLRKHPSLTGDLDSHPALTYVNKITGPQSFWFEIYTRKEFVGFMYFTIEGPAELEFHVYFFNRKLSDKVALCRHVIRWIFATYKVNRMSMSVASIYHATMRLAKHIGFKYEGCRKNRWLIGGKYVNEVLYGLLSEEMD